MTTRRLSTVELAYQLKAIAERRMKRIGSMTKPRPTPAPTPAPTAAKKKAKAKK